MGPWFWRLHHRLGLWYDKTATKTAPSSCRCSQTLNQNPSNWHTGKNTQILCTSKKKNKKSTTGERFHPFINNRHQLGWCGRPPKPFLYWWWWRRFTLANEKWVSMFARRFPSPRGINGACEASSRKDWVNKRPPSLYSCTWKTQTLRVRLRKAHLSITNHFLERWKKSRKKLGLSDYRDSLF